MADRPVPSAKLREALHGVPEETILACAEFQGTRGEAAFEQALSGLITHYLPAPPARPVATLPATTNLVTELRLDSLAMVELAFVCEDIFGVRLTPETLGQAVTLGDLRALLRAALQLPPVPAV